MTDILLQFDPASVARIAKIAEFETILRLNFLLAMQDSLDNLETAAQGEMWSMFLNPSGQLEDAFEKTVYGPYKAALSNPLPYAWRREMGFSGMTDSLGRFFPNDPGIAFMHTAIDIAYDEVQMNFQEALDRTIAVMVM
jgi:hypothetical protein